jgi:hypothetical protein
MASIAKLSSTRSTEPHLPCDFEPRDTARLSRAKVGRELISLHVLIFA